MAQSKVQFAEIRYNPELSAFQTRATIHDDGVAYVYPVHLRAPLTAEFDYVAARLVKKARRMHDRRQSSLHMHHQMIWADLAPEHPRAA